MFLVLFRQVLKVAELSSSLRNPTNASESSYQEQTQQKQDKKKTCQKELFQRSSTFLYRSVSGAKPRCGRYRGG
jgi:hypothetical protein